MSWREYIACDERDRMDSGAPLSAIAARRALESFVDSLIRARLPHERRRELDLGLDRLKLTHHRNPWLDHHIATAEDFVLALLKPADDAFAGPMQHTAIWMDAKAEQAKTAIAGYFAHYHDQAS